RSAILSRLIYRHTTTTLFSTSTYYSSQSPCDHRHLPSFPTRRSSDLVLPADDRRCHQDRDRGRRIRARASRGAAGHRPSLEKLRSEEHTSELQSLTNIVCRLLLEKKKKSTNSRFSNFNDCNSTQLYSV